MCAGKKVDARAVRRYISASGYLCSCIIYIEVLILLISSDASISTGNRSVGFEKTVSTSFQLHLE